MSNEVEIRINKRSEQIERRLDGGLNSDGKIDLDQLERSDNELFTVLNEFMASKTWRDDPVLTARDVSKLLEARSQNTALGQALDRLGENIED